MKAWLSALPVWLSEGHDCVLITVTHVLGSTPRDAGASMLVSLDAQQTLRQIDTIGGGHLEWQACEIAQAMLLQGESPIRLEAFNLGARLGQCCGGKLWAIFEYISASEVDIWQTRTQALSHADLAREVSKHASASLWTLQSASAQADRVSFNHQAEHWQFSQRLSASQFSVVILGAGHVGEAVVRLLLTLDARVRWVDSRDEVFPDLIHPNLTCIATDSPEAEIDLAPVMSYFLIMTHDHALDLLLCQALFKRGEFAFFGLIGSQSKRAVFERRLAAKGIVDEQLAQMICPIGMAGIRGKEPEVIAVSVVAQLLEIRSTRQAAARVLIASSQH